MNENARSDLPPALPQGTTRFGKDGTLFIAFALVAVWLLIAYFSLQAEVDLHAQIDGTLLQAAVPLTAPGG